jgi:hypothetical protein
MATLEQVDQRSADEATHGSVMGYKVGVLNRQVGREHHRITQPAGGMQCKPTGPQKGNLPDRMRRAGAVHNRRGAPNGARRLSVMGGEFFHPAVIASRWPIRRIRGAHQLNPPELLTSIPGVESSKPLALHAHAPAVASKVPSTTRTNSDTIVPHGDPWSNAALSLYHPSGTWGHASHRWKQIRQWGNLSGQCSPAAWNQRPGTQIQLELARERQAVNAADLFCLE